MISSLNTIIGRLHAKQLRLLVALDHRGSLLGAAKEVSLSQPGASKALREIESTFGVELFTRSNRGLEPNAAGHSVIRYAKLFHTDIAHLREELLGVLAGRGGRVAVGTIMGAVPLLTEALTRLLATQPHISVEIIEDTSAALLALIDDGRLDVAICRTSVSRSPELYASVEVQKEVLMIIASAQHPLTKRKRLSLENLVDMRWIVYRANMPIRRLLEREFHEAGLRMPQHLIETTSGFATISLLQSKPGFVTMLPASVAGFFVSQGWASELPLSVTSRSEPYELVTRQGASLTPGAHLLLAELKKLSDA